MKAAMNYKILTNFYLTTFIFYMFSCTINKIIYCDVIVERHKQDLSLSFDLNIKYVLKCLTQIVNFSHLSFISICISINSKNFISWAILISAIIIKNDMFATSTINNEHLNFVNNGSNRFWLNLIKPAHTIISQ